MKVNVHADRVQEHLNMCLEYIQILRKDVVGTELDEPPAGARVVMTLARKIGDVALSEGAGADCLAPREDVTRRGRHRESAANYVYI